MENQVKTALPIPGLDTEQVSCYRNHVLRQKIEAFVHRIEETSVLDFSH